MSRHIIPNAPGSPPGRETTVGWKAEFHSFFAEAFDPPAGVFDEGTPVFWFGLTPWEITSIAALARRLAEHDVDLPAVIAAALVDESADEDDRSQGRPESALTAQAGEV